MTTNHTSISASAQEGLKANLDQLGNQNEKPEQVWSAPLEGDEEHDEMRHPKRQSASDREDPMVKPGFSETHDEAAEVVGESLAFFDEEEDEAFSLPSSLRLLSRHPQEGDDEREGLLENHEEETEGDEEQDEPLHNQDEEDDFFPPSLGDKEKVETANSSIQPINSRERHTANLLGLGITEEAIAARSSSGSSLRTTGGSAHRINHINAIRQIAPEVIAEHDGTVMFCAETVLKYLVKAGHGRTARGEIIRGANCIGDACGGHGLHLPSLTKDGKRRYALSMVNATDEEKASLQESLHTMSKKELNALRVG